MTTGAPQRVTEVETASGLFVDLAQPDPSTIRLEDIAHGLSLTCRYGGQCARFYSVAEHASLVAWRLLVLGEPPAVRLAGLHHDDAEAYVGDVTRPLKALLPDFVEREAYLAFAIRVGLALPLDLSDDATAAVKAADDWALHVEAQSLMPSRGEGWTDRPDDVPAPPWTLGMAPADARGVWLAEHAGLVATVAGGRA